MVELLKELDKTQGLLDAKNDTLQAIRAERVRVTIWHVHQTFFLMAHHVCFWSVLCSLRRRKDSRLSMNWRICM